MRPFFTRVINPPLMPIMAGAPSVQICLKFCQLSSCVSKKESTITLMSAAVVVADKVLQKRNSSFIFLFFFYRANAIKWHSRVVSVDSSSCRLAWSMLCLISEQTCWHMSVAMSSIRRRIVLFEIETCWIFFFAPSPIIISTIFPAHGLTSSSAIVCDFLHFAI